MNSSTPSPFPLHSLCPLLWSLGTFLTVTLRSGMALPRLTSRPSFLPAGRKSGLERQPPKLMMVAGIRYESTLPQTWA